MVITFLMEHVLWYVLLLVTTMSCSSEVMLQCIPYNAHQIGIQVFIHDFSPGGRGGGKWHYYHSMHSMPILGGSGDMLPL